MRMAGSGLQGQRYENHACPPSSQKILSIFDGVQTHYNTNISLLDEKDPHG
jgi:hypothetical protein